MPPLQKKASPTRLFICDCKHSVLQVVADVRLCAERASVSCRNSCNTPTTKSDSARPSRPTTEVCCTGGGMTGSPSCRARVRARARARAFLHSAAYRTKAQLQKSHSPPPQLSSPSSSLPLLHHYWALLCVFLSFSSITAQSDRCCSSPSTL